MISIIQYKMAIDLLLFSCKTIYVWNSRLNIMTARNFSTVYNILFWMLHNMLTQIFLRDGTLRNRSSHCAKNGSFYSSQLCNKSEASHINMKYWYTKSVLITFNIFNSVKLNILSQVAMLKSVYIFILWGICALLNFHATQLSSPT